LIYFKYIGVAYKAMGTGSLQRKVRDDYHPGEAAKDIFVAADGPSLISPRKKNRICFRGPQTSWRRDFSTTALENTVRLLYLDASVLLR